MHVGIEAQIIDKIILGIFEVYHNHTITIYGIWHQHIGNHRGHHSRLCVDLLVETLRGFGGSGLFAWRRRATCQLFHGLHSWGWGDA